MNKTKMLGLLQPHIIKTEKINSNNGWGFGGARKKVYTLDKDCLTLHDGIASFRHLPNESFFILRDKKWNDIATTPKSITKALISMGYDVLDI